MQIYNQHIIQCVNLEITTNDESQAFAIRKNIGDFLKEHLLPQLEMLFDETVPSEEIRRFDSLELSLHLKSINDMNSVKDQLISQLHDKIEFAASTLNHPADSKPITQQGPDQKRNDENIFMSFLDSGQLPWFATPSKFHDYLQSGNLLESLKNDLFIQRLKKQFYTNKQSITRFIQQFDNKHIEELIIQLSGENKIDRTKLHFQISRHDQQIKDAIYFLIISSLIQTDKSVSTELFQDLIREIQLKTGSKLIAIRKSKQILVLLNSLHLKNLTLVANQITDTNNRRLQTTEAEISPQNPPLSSEPDINLPEVSHFRTGKSETKEIPDQEQETDQNTTKINKKTVYVENAGLILVHPFLWDLFTRTKCTDEVNALLPDKKDLAVHILHFLATGREQEMEYMLTFEKFLCGIPLDSPVSRQIVLSDQAKIECNDLLLSIIRFWPELKNTSQDGLRQMFLQRNGKLDLQKPPYKLFIERKAQDVLMDHLQWNISIVKLPWFQELLFTEW